MRRKILNESQETWLIQHFPDMSNEELAKKLTNIVREHYIIEVQKLRSLLPSLQDSATKRAVLKSINDMESFDGISVNYVKKTAKRLGCLKKSGKYISNVNRAKVTKKFIQQWRDKAVYTPEPFNWFRSLETCNTYFSKFDSQQQMLSFKSSVCNYNRKEAPKAGRYLIADYYKECLLARVFVSSYSAPKQ